MTEHDSKTDTHRETQEELMARLMDVYDVPIDLIRYEQSDRDAEV